MPHNTGLLTLSGMLYEGNYAEWIMRLEAFLEIHGIIPNVGNGLNPPRFYSVLWGKVMEFVRSNVSPYLLLRVSESDSANPEITLAILKRVAQPFRLADLPPELRSMVFTIFLQSKECAKEVDSTWHPEGTPSSTWTYSIEWPPDILAHNLGKTNRLFRAEVLPMHLALTEVELESNDGYEITVEHILAWASGITPFYTKMLRRLTLHSSIWDETREEGYGITLRFQWSRSSGLSCIGNGELTERSEAILQEHVKKMGAISDSLGLEGQSMLLAMTSDPLMLRGLHGPGPLDV